MTVLDGGLATELEARGHDLSDELWSARLLADDPEEIVAVHEAFFRAGARIATTASYQASFAGFAARGFDARQTVALLHRSVELARKAGTRVDGPRWVAASVGPYGATLADGSEYRGRYGLSVAGLTAFHRPRAAALAEARPDVLALETVPDVDEAVALLAAVEGLGVPAWLSYTIAGDRTRAGQPLAEAFAVAAGRDDVVAVGVNCCDPDDAARAIPVAREVSGKPVIAYPNSGEEWDAAGRRWAGRSRFTPDRVAGADLAGGCCRVRPVDIEALAATRVSETPGHALSAPFGSRGAPFPRSVG
ncbi:homocysteine S-methyltransferase [Amycolatopsis acidiphila]|uniref:Homocysteine S-methyltransferase n=1 Tax=Amycolatopsis acidiphila TaxID=715473 RepID=A0A558AKF2_9PSEU|nr:homocysteine S-methyltransferase [Amycolatopsis acidiphila]TVT24746.1 homocysteine S-methyltransferase [Amycolatopsis acidiphila]UIJ62714.1 homocysteine S-methyltransferase [Amycolatopsis acidiphila]GHG63750.1 homocysteine S-methyltransferase [Amycolatopsis acidiphila]